MPTAGSAKTTAENSWDPFDTGDQLLTVYGNGDYEILDFDPGGKN
jgi:hypothetical protein